MKKNATEMVKRLLERGGTITSMQAFSKFNITRLSGLIFQLRKKGMKIETIPQHKNGKTFGKYKKAA